MKIVVAYDSSTSHFSTFFCLQNACVCVFVNVKRIKCAFKLENRKWRFRFCLQLNFLSLTRAVLFFEMQIDWVYAYECLMCNFMRWKIAVWWGQQHTNLSLSLSIYVYEKKKILMNLNND